VLRFISIYVSLVLLRLIGILCFDLFLVISATLFSEYINLFQIIYWCSLVLQCVIVLVTTHHHIKYEAIWYILIHDIPLFQKLDIWPSHSTVSTLKHLPHWIITSINY